MTQIASISPVESGMQACVPTAFEKMLDATGKLRRGRCSIFFSSSYQINSSDADWRKSSERVTRGRAEEVSSVV